MCVYCFYNLLQSFLPPPNSPPSLCMFPQDRKIKCSVYRVAGPIPVNNYILFPTTSTQSLRLTGHFFYLVFRPTPGWFFVMHLDLATEDGLSVRISLSNLYKCFKKSATWAQLPLVYSEKTGEAVLVCSSERENESESLSQPAPENSRWTFLALDLQAMVFELFRNHYAHVKTVKLCANMTVKGAYTSDIKYCPDSHTAGDQNGIQSAAIEPVPREMSLPVRKGMNFTDVYCIVRYPSSVEMERVDVGMAKRSPLQRRENTNAVVSLGQGVVKEREEQNEELVHQRPTHAKQKKGRSKKVSAVNNVLYLI